MDIPYIVHALAILNESEITGLSGQGGNRSISMSVFNTLDSLTLKTCRLSPFYIGDLSTAWAAADRPYRTPGT